MLGNAEMAALRASFCSNDSGMLFNGGADDDDDKGALVEPTNLRGRTRLRGADASAMDGKKKQRFR